MKGDYGEAELARVKWHLANYWDIRKAIVDRRLELKKRTGAPERSGSGYVSDPVAREAEIDLRPLKFVEVGTHTVRQPEAWVAAISCVLNGISKEDRHLVEATFWKHRPRGERTFIASELHLDKNTYYRRKDKLVSLFAIAAASANLITLPFVPGP